MQERVRKLNSAAVRTGGRYVLYWCRWNRRVESNHALAFAADMANQANLPLVVFESLTCTYPYANDRLHTFVLEGVEQTAKRMRQLGIGYVFHLPRTRAAEEGLQIMVRGAASIVTDDCMIPAPAVDVAIHVVDASCIVPMSAIPARSYAAYAIRPRIHKLLPDFLKPAPAVRVRRRCGEKFPDLHTDVKTSRVAELVASCEIDHGVRPSVTFRGGRAEAERILERFLTERLRRYARDKNEPTKHATSELSPYLHFGFISALEIALTVRRHAAEHKLIADEFLEELIVRRELAFNFARYAERVDSLAELPEWARATLDKHRADPRQPVYTRAQFESASTYDDLWNATQRDLLLRGKIHGYYRMYWGKKILEWSRTPENALETMIYLHDRYALDGQDPNTYTNILWCFGLHDRPWGERPVYGTVRSMGRAGMERKTDVSAYVREIEQLERTAKELAT